jgi:hypothetical protein
MPDAVGKKHALDAISPDPIRRHFMSDVIPGIEGQKSADAATLGAL